MLRKRVDAYVAGLATQLDAARAKQLRRQLSTIADECGSKVTPKFVEALSASLRLNGLHAASPLTFNAVRRSDTVLLSRTPPPERSAVFMNEADLARFVLANLGKGPFAGLEPYKPAGRKSASEYRLSNGKRVDLLCRERNPPDTGAVVAIEFKKQDAAEALMQILEYLDLLRQEFKGRPVRGIIISANAEEAARVLAHAKPNSNITWLTYDVKFPKVTPKA